MVRPQHAKELIKGSKCGINVMKSYKNASIPDRRYHWHDFYEIFYIAQGKCQLILEGKNYTLDTKSIVMIKPYELHQTRRDPTSDGDITVVQFFPSELKSVSDYNKNDSKYMLLFMNQENSASRIMRYPYGNAEQIEFLFSEIAREFNEHKIGYEEILSGYLKVLLGLFKRNSIWFSTVSGAGMNFDISEICRYIEDNRSSKLTLGQVAAKFGYSNAYFTKLFLKYTGSTYRKFLGYILFREAHNMIEIENCPRKEVAELLGYSNVSNFSRTYNKMCLKYLNNL
jgi:YesN/AraC family two-component response regulator